MTKLSTLKVLEYRFTGKELNGKSTSILQRTSLVY